MEEWKIIASYPSYEVSSIGRVRRCIDSPTGHKAGTLMKPKTSAQGYLLVALCRKGLPKWISVHRVVMSAFVGASHLQVNHKNGNSKDNRLENLEYCTAQQNSWHRARVLKRNGGFRPRLSEESVRAIFRRRKEGALLREIAVEVGCTESNVHYILNGKSRGSVSS